MCVYYEFNLGIYMDIMVHLLLYIFLNAMVSKIVVMYKIILSEIDGKINHQ